MSKRKSAPLLILLALLLLTILPVSYHLATTDPDVAPAPEPPEDADLSELGESAAAESPTEPPEVAPLPPDGGAGAGGEEGAGGSGDDGKEAAGPAAKGAAAGKGEKAAPAAPAGYFPKFRVKVVDLLTGEPVAGARILYGPLPSWSGSTTGKAGVSTFGIPEPGSWGRDYRVRVSAPGYETVELTPEEAEVTLELRPDNRPAWPGRVFGRAEDRDGRPLEGVVWVVLAKGGVRTHWLYVNADPIGDFVLDGVEPGDWSICLEGGAMVDFYMPSDGEAHVTLRSGRLRGEKDEKARRLEETRREIAELEKEREALGGKEGPRARLLTDRIRVLEYRARLMDMEQAPRPRREIAVTGLAGHDGQILVAEYYGSSIERWRAVIRDGAARFPALFAAKWHLTVLDPAGTKKAVTVTVPKDSSTEVAYPSK